MANPFHKRRKFANEKVLARWIDGSDITFDSKAESKHGELLVARLRLGEISDLKRQVKYELIVNGELICSYFADFVYTENGTQVVVDVKSAITRTLPDYRIKNKLMHALYGVTIVEVTNDATKPKARSKPGKENPATHSES